MSKRFVWLCLSVSCLAIAFCLGRLFARETAPSNWKALEIQYAKANLELAQARLSQAQRQNKQTNGTVPQERIDLLKAGVKLTQDQLQQLESKPGGSGSSYLPRIAAAQEELKALVADHNQSLQANKLQAGSVPESQVQLEQAEIDYATSRLATLKALAQQPLETRLQWEIQQLQDDVRALWVRPLITD